MKSLLQFWQTWAVLSAVAAAATAILAKAGVEAISSDLATLIRTAVVPALVSAHYRQWKPRDAARVAPVDKLSVVRSPFSRWCSSANACRHRRPLAWR